MPDRRHLVRWSLTLVVAACWVLLGLSLLSFSPTDWPSHAIYPHPATQNLCGEIGAFVAYQLFSVLGSGAYMVMLFAGLFIGLRIWNQPLSDFWLRVIGLSMLAVSVGAMMHLVVPGTSRGLPEGAGGTLGIAASNYLKSHFHAVGAAIVLMLAFMLGMLLAADELVVKMPVIVGGAYRRVKNRVPEGGINFPPMPRLPSLPRFVTRDALESVKELEPEPTIRQRAKKLKKDAEELFVKGEPIDADDVIEVPPEAISRTKALPDKKAKPVVVEEPEEVDDEIEPAVNEEKKRNIIVRLAASMPTKRTAPPPPKELGEYTMPCWDVLADAEHGYAETQEQFVREQAAILEQALREFNIDAHVIEVDTGPVITMYELSLAAGVRVSAIQGLANDIARSLSATAVRIVAPVPGKNTVGIEVPNNEKEKVRMKELMQTAPESVAKMEIPLFLGKDASGNALITDLTKMPHCLIAGTTGSGKSVCINTIIMSIMYTQRPDVVKMILVDPKVVEMAPFKDIPHLMCPVITETAKATSVLEWATSKMEERYAIMAEAGVRNIAGFNKLTREELIERFNPTTPEEEAKIPKKLPYIVIIIDELADLMMTSGKEVEQHIVRIAQKARAVGIHLILATQRPQATVVTGLIKANMPSKIAFRVGSRMDSRIVLDMNGAEVLLGQGDMLYLPNGASKPTRSQGTYIDDKEIRDSVKLVKELAEQQFEPDLVQIRAAGNGEPSGERDELFDDAVRVVLETKRGSVSLLQRRLTIGYGRASRLIEQMYEAGLVGEYKGSQAREPTITLEEWETMKAAQQADEESGMSV
ncbi:MAG TPA: DNA translocase FtsK [Tepidisphaeraceae bacterium]|nr:DNA translocase FtsK [Tepidisphaeraceae bacterium]